MSKNQSYRDLKLKERAEALANEKGLPLDEALHLARKERASSDEKMKALGKRKSRTSQKREIRNAAKERNNAVKEFGNELSPGAPPFQGGAPGGGKRK